MKSFRCSLFVFCVRTVFLYLFLLFFSGWFSFSPNVQNTICSRSNWIFDWIKKKTVSTSFMLHLMLLKKNRRQRRRRRRREKNLLLMCVALLYCFVLRIQTTLIYMIYVYNQSWMMAKFNSIARYICIIVHWHNTYGLNTFKSNK